jgi:hypothetical protein
MRQQTGYDQVFSSGGGTQSACIAAMICNGDLPKPGYSIIADTGYELSTTWEYHDQVVYPALKKSGVELIRVRAKDYATVELYGGKNGDSLLIPAFTTESGEVGKLPAYCSNEWKQRVIQRWLREQGVKKAQIWLGYSIDERHRIRVKEGNWINAWPLIEKRFNRQNSINYVKEIGWPEPPRSACWMCPNRNLREWADQKENNPEDFKKAVNFENAIQRKDPDVWLTEKAQPLGEISFVNGSDGQDDLFESHCPNTGCFT